MHITENKLLVTCLVIDLFLLYISMLVAYYLNLGEIQALQQYHFRFYMLQATLAWMITYLVFVKNNLFFQKMLRHRLYHIFRRVVLFTVVLITMTFIFMKGSVARMYMLSYISVFFVLEGISYWLIYNYMCYYRSRDGYSRRVLLIGYGKTSALFRKMINSMPLLGYEFIGYLKYDARDINDIPEEERPYVIGNTSQLKQMIKDHNIHTVFSLFSLFRDKTGVDSQLVVCNEMGVHMYLVVESRRWIQPSEGVELLGDFYILNLQRIPLDGIMNRTLKRIFDIFFSLAVLLLFSWSLFPLIALMIKLTSKGPVFFVQERTGINNIPFRCYKFRSMCLNQDSDKKQATKNDSRITPFGNFMRRWNIDELPQFLNVLGGQMSVVGPRPHMLSHTEQYSALIKYYNVRHYVKPGVTGWAQVNGWHGETDETWKMEKRVEYDREYIENWTFLWDMKIIWLTVFGRKTRVNAG